MKKIISVFFVVWLSVMIAGCKKEETHKKESTQQPIEKKKESIQLPIERKTMEDEGTFKEVDQKAEEETVKEEEGKKRIEITKESKETQLESQLEKKVEKHLLTPHVVSQIQKALKEADYDPGPVDGIIGQLTIDALQSYQKDKGLTVGDLTYETINSLGIELDKQ